MRFPDIFSRIVEFRRKHEAGPRSPVAAEPETFLLLDGLRVDLFRSRIDGRLVVHVSNNLSDEEERQARDLAPGDVPVFRLLVNDVRAYTIEPSGRQEVGDPDEVDDTPTHVYTLGPITRSDGRS